MKTIGDDQLLRRMGAEMRALDGKPCRIELSAAAALALVGQLQLALRHPQNTGDTARTARGLICELQEYFARHDAPGIAECIDRGFARVLDSCATGGLDA